MRCRALSVGPMEPLPSPAIRLLAREILNRTEVDAADSVVLVAHTRVLSLSYFGCHTHAFGWDSMRSGATGGPARWARARVAPLCLNPIGRPSNGAANGGAVGAALTEGYRGLGHDPLDGAGTASAPDAAAEASVDLLCTQRLLSRCRHHAPYLVVSQNIARADDHSAASACCLSGSPSVCQTSTSASERASTSASS